MTRRIGSGRRERMTYARAGSPVLTERMTYARATDLWTDSTFALRACYGSPLLTPGVVLAGHRTEL
eukprot:3691876-Rhodomonas_salina.6